MQLVHEIKARLPAQRHRRQHTAVEPPVVVPVSTPERELLLVVGMQWHTILGSDLPAQARRKARHIGARYWVHAGGRSESVGTAALPRHRLSMRHPSNMATQHETHANDVWAESAVSPGHRNEGSSVRQRSVRSGSVGFQKEAHSAAQIIALRHAVGVHAFTLQLPDTRYWVVVVRDGQVVNRSDVVVHTAAEAAQLLQQAIKRFGAELQLSGQSSKLLGNPSSSRTSDSGSVSELMHLALETGPRSLLRTSSALPGGARAAMVVTAASMAVASVWYTEWRDAGAVPAGSAQPQLRLSALQTEHRWQQYLTQWLNSAGTPSHTGMQRLWQAIGTLPVAQAGWTLQSFHCQEQGVPWHCDARYVRSRTHASAAAFMALARPHWQVSWPQLDEASVQFKVQVARQPLDLDNLMHEPVGLIPDADLLQAIRPLLRAIRVDAPRSVQLQPPRDGNGAVLAKPDSVPSLATREITLQAPLRSFTLLTPELTKRIAWHELVVHLQPRVEPTTKTSVLMATLRGKSFETSL